MAQLCSQFLCVQWYINKNMNDCFMDVDKAGVYLGSLLGVHLASFHKDYLKWDRHIPHTCLYLLQRESERRGTDLQ